MTSKQDTTVLLRRWTRGDEAAGEELFERLYDDLRAVASNRLKAENRSRLETTALVHEAFLRVAGQDRAAYQNRGHFFAIAASVMRRILVDDARARAAKKRGGDKIQVSLEDLGGVAFNEKPEQLLELEEVLREMETRSPEQVRLVELRFFAGLSLEETAEALDVSRATVVRKWRVTKGSLHRRLARR